MMEEEITEVTLIQREGKKGPSFWTNLIVLLVLVGLILWAQQWATRLSGEVLPEEETDKQIVLEDLETQKPLVEAEEVAVPSVTTPPVKEETENGGPKIEIQKPKPEEKKTKVVKKVAPSIYAHDPYTNGSATDLDRRENWKNYFPNRPQEILIKEKVPAGSGKTEATATSPLPSERDRFIPFESE